MSIDGKHSYRFGFLKSDKWKLLRTEVLVRDGATCQICGVESFSNDAHHIYYRLNVYDTVGSDLILLCRDCHDLIHILTIPGKESHGKHSKEEAVENFSAAKLILQRIEKTLKLNGLLQVQRDLKRKLKDKTKTTGWTKVYESNVCARCKTESSLCEAVNLIRAFDKDEKGFFVRVLCPKCYSQFLTLINAGLFKAAHETGKIGFAYQNIRHFIQGKIIDTHKEV